MANENTEPASQLLQIIYLLSDRNGLERSFEKALLAAASLHRVKTVYLGRAERGEDPSERELIDADVALLKVLLAGAGNRAALMFNLGYSSGHSLIKEAMSNLKLNPEDQREYDGGSTHAVLGTLGGITNKEPADLKMIEEQLDQVMNSISVKTIQDTQRGLHHRKDLLRLLNAVILLEESKLILAGHGRGQDKELRKISMEYATMRLLGALSLTDTLEMDDMRSFFSIVGKTARLNRQFSDALDRVDKYCHSAAGDEEKREVAVAVGRPFPDNLRDIAVASRQCRLFRNRELR